MLLDALGTMTTSLRSPRTRTTWAAGVLIAGVLLSGDPARAQCVMEDDDLHVWGPVATGPGSASPIDTTFSMGLLRPLSYFVQGLKLFAVDDTLGHIKWTFPSGFGPRLGTPTSVISGGGSEFVFVGTDDGFLYKVRV